jgi:hypothetical protein
MRKAILLMYSIIAIYSMQAQAGDFGRLKKLIENRDLEGLKAVIASGADVNERSGLWGVTPLIIAATSQDVKFVQVLVEGGADVNGANKLGYTALHQAAMDDNVEIAKYLLDHGADTEARGTNGIAPLISAISSPKVALLLIERGADYLAKASNGETFVTFVEAYSKDGNVLEKVRLGAQATKEATFPVIERIEHEKQAKGSGSSSAFATLFGDLVDYFNSPEGKVLTALSAEAIRYIYDGASKYEPPSEPRLSSFSDWYEHADGSRHREVTLFCPRPSGVVVEIEERYSQSGKHWFQRDAGAVLLPKHHETLAEAISIECSAGSGLIDRDRNEQEKNEQSGE